MAGSWSGSSEGGSLSDENYFFDRRIEPIYDSFVCSLTKQVMHDPVTIENGQTFEREAIEKWFKECKESGRKPVCPVTGEELKTTDLNPSIALRHTIEEWTARNEAIELDKAYASLSMGTSEKDILQGLNFVQHICLKSQSNKHVVHQPGMVHLVIDLLKNTSRKVRLKALETLQVLAEEDSTKEIVAEGDTVRTIVKFLHLEKSREREEAVALLYELSKSEILCEKIGSINGAILLLIGMTSSESENVVAVGKADKALDNLAKCENNVRQMAENGRLRPLLTLLLEGLPETKLSMAALLGDLVLNNDVKVLVAKTVGSSLIDLMRMGDLPAREASLKALNQISSCEASAMVLINEGILPPLVTGLFSVGFRHHPAQLKEVSATILSNIVHSGYDFSSFVIGSGNQTLVSENIIHELLHLISNTGPATGCKLLQVLVGLTSSTTVSNVVSAIKSSGATISLVQFIEAPQRDLRLAATKLLQNLSPYMSQELADALRGTAGQLGSLVNIILESIAITEEQAAAVKFLADLLEEDVGLTQQMLDEGVFPQIISRVRGIRQGITKGNRFMTPYLEGLVRILAQVTYILTEQSDAVVRLCRQHDVALLFTDLLLANGLENVQIASAWALSKLSHESKRLTRLPEMPPPAICASIFSCFSKAPEITGLCRVHGGLCSLRETFCLVEGQAVEKLVSLLDHTNENAIEASLAALSTLLDDGVNIEQGVVVLTEAEGTSHIFEVLVAKQNENLRRRAVWAVERLLRVEGIAIDVSSDANVATALVDAFQNADYRTRQIAERALKLVDRIPNFSGIFPSAS